MSCPSTKRARMLSLLAAALTQCTSGVAQNPPDYTLSIVARTGDTIDKHKLLYLGSPAINNKGEIVFTARFADRPEPEYNSMILL